MMTKLKLTVNETKTRVSKLPEEKFDFLGYTFGRCYSTKTGRANLGTIPAKKRVIRICQAISSETGRNRTLLDHKTVVTKLNQMMNGWANYFCLGPVSKAYRAVDRHARKRLRQWLCAKHQAAWPATGNFSEASLYDTFGLVRVTERTLSRQRSRVRATSSTPYIQNDLSWIGGNQGGCKRTQIYVPFVSFWQIRCLPDTPSLSRRPECLLTAKSSFHSRTRQGT